MNIEFNETYQNYIQEQLDAGTYANTNELLGEALRLKMQQDADEQAKTEALRAAFFEGENSGEAEPWDINQIIAEAKQEINA
jgi:antitoxin ParD1/3/4